MSLDLKEAQVSWAYHKYWVMGRSQQVYMAIRLLFKGNDWTEAKSQAYQAYLGQAEATKASKKTRTVVYQHLWGYVKKQATEEEKQTYQELLAGLSDQTDAFFPFICHLIDKYQPAYLLQSKIYQEGLDSSL